MAKAQISIPLDIDDVNVLKVEVNQNGELHITLESSLNYGYCRRCGQKLTKLHSYDAWMKVRHLPILGRAVFLHSESIQKMMLVAKSRDSGESSKGRTASGCKRLAIQPSH